MKQAFLLISLFTLVTSVSAVTLEKLYDVAITVNSQSGSDRDQAISQAFGQLLIKVTGQPDIAQKESGKMLIKKAKRFVRSFRYAPVEREISENIISPWQKDEEQLEIPAEDIELTDENLSEQQLVVSFDEKAVRNALWQAKLPVWGKTRPATLLWIAFQDSEKRMLLDANRQTELQFVLDKRSSMRGVPILYPKQDLEDQKNVNVTDVWGGFKEPLKTASLRYDAAAVVAAQLSLAKDDTWQTRWSLFIGDESEHWRISGQDIAATLEQSIDELAKRLAKRYVNISVAVDGDTLIYVSDVDNVVDYDRVSKYLNGLASVKKAELVQVHANEVVFRLKMRSSAKQFKQAIALGKTLTSRDVFATDNEDARITYRLIQ